MCLVIISMDPQYGIHFKDLGYTFRKGNHKASNMRLAGGLLMRMAVMRIRLSAATAFMSHTSCLGFSVIRVSPWRPAPWY